VVAPRFRDLGIAKALLRDLLANKPSGGVFATTGADNPMMQEILKNSGFEILGWPFPGVRTPGKNVLWVRHAADTD
jgi:hypothetical protein